MAADEAVPPPARRQLRRRTSLRTSASIRAHAAQAQLVSFIPMRRPPLLQLSGTPSRADGAHHGEALGSDAAPPVSTSRPIPPTYSPPRLPLRATSQLPTARSRASSRFTPRPGTSAPRASASNTSTATMTKTRLPASKPTTTRRGSGGWTSGRPPSVTPTTRCSG
jgi:hypothetical protein